MYQYLLPVSERYSQPLRGVTQKTTRIWTKIPNSAGRNSNSGPPKDAAGMLPTTGQQLPSPCASPSTRGARSSFVYGFKLWFVYVTLGVSRKRLPRLCL